MQLCIYLMCIIMLLPMEIIVWKVYPYCNIKSRFDNFPEGACKLLTSTLHHLVDFAFYVQLWMLCFYTF